LNGRPPTTGRRALPEPCHKVFKVSLSAACGFGSTLFDIHTVAKQQALGEQSVLDSCFALIKLHDFATSDTLWIRVVDPFPLIWDPKRLRLSFA
jgi:hypothetical protein